MFSANSMAGSVSQPFTLTVTQLPAASIASTAGTLQTATVNTAFGTQLQATVLDANGTPVSGATVTFAAPSAGPSGTFVGGGVTDMETTNGQGVATAQVFTANGIAGYYAVTASVSGVSAPAIFGWYNLPAGTNSVAAWGNNAFANWATDTLKTAQHLFR